MKEIDYIAKKTIKRMDALFEQKGKILIKENSRLAELIGETEDWIAGGTERYQFLTEHILKDDPAAKNVLDMSLATALYPEFAVELKRLTLHEATVKNGWLAMGINMPDYVQLTETFRLLCGLYEVNRKSYPFFDIPFYADNRLIGYLCGDDALDVQTAVYGELYLADGQEAEKEEVSVCEAASRCMAQGISMQFRSDDAKEGCRKLLQYCAVQNHRTLIFVNLFDIRQEQFSDIIFRIMREALFYQAYVCFQGVEKSFFKEQKLTLHQFYGIFVRPLEERRIPVCFCSEENIRIHTVMRTKLEILTVAKGIFLAQKGILAEPMESMNPDALVTSEQNQRLMEKICNHRRFARLVYQDWNMGRQYPYGKGVCALFAGPPGTGKTMAAHVISNMLDLPLYHVDLSQVVDKYIGETEKNLEGIFRYAEQNDVILFFDEADALFGKRGEVKEARDRYANTEISYILQRIERHEGIVILATNLKGNIDPAFMRRMKYIVNFAMPDESMRLEIWKKGFSKEVPTAELDFEYLARQFELSGGNIKNIILTAVFDAAGNGEPVGMKHILDAVAGEFAKYNKTMTEGEFGEYSYLWKRTA